MVNNKLVAIMVIMLWPQISAIAIKAFQPEVVPSQSITTLTITTSGQLNTSSLLRCRFNDISMPANLKGHVVFCNTPPIRHTNKVALHLEVDGKFYKAKKPLRLHEPFKAVDIWPKTAFPSQQIQILIGGITCESWMMFFVRLQTLNGTKRTHRGVCVNSTIAFYLPEFQAHALLRVGVTLSNKIVEWCHAKLLVQYPIDSKQSLITTFSPNFQKKGAISFKVVPRDKFNHTLLVDKHFKPEGFAVQYSPENKPNQFSFLRCQVLVGHEATSFTASCSGAKSEKIIVYPTINNVIIGGPKAYKVTTTLCPGKPSCSAFIGEEGANKIVIILLPSIIIPMITLIMLAGLCKYRKFVKEKSAWTWMKPRVIYSDQETNQEIEMLMQFSGENSSEPFSEVTEDQELPLGFDHLLTQNQEDEIQTIASDGVCVVIDGPVGLAQKIGNPHLPNGKNTSDNTISENLSKETDIHNIVGSNLSEIDVDAMTNDSACSHATGCLICEKVDRRESCKERNKNQSVHIVKTIASSFINNPCTESGIHESVETSDLIQSDRTAGRNSAQQSGEEDIALVNYNITDANKTDSSSTSEDEEFSLRHKLMSELKARLRMKYRRSKIEDNDNKK